MIVTPKPTFLDHQPIPVPWASGIKDLDRETDVWLYQLPVSGSWEAPITELVITPIRRELWRDIWTLELTVKEKRGTFSRLSRVLSDLGINIILEYSATSHHGRNHTAQFVIDCHGYKSALDLNTERRSSLGHANLEELSTRLLVEFIDEIILVRPRVPSFRMHRNLNLFHLYSDLIQNPGRTREHKLTLEDGAIGLPQQILDFIRRSHFRLIPESGALQPMGLSVLEQNSDLLRIFVFFRETGIIAITLRLRNEPGAIAAATDLLQHLGFSVISSKSWTSCDMEYTNLWLLIQSETCSDCSEQPLLAKVTEAFATPPGELLRYGPVVGTPPTFFD